MRVTYSIFLTTRLCLVAALWIMATGCGVEQLLDPSSGPGTSDTKSNSAAPRTEFRPAVHQPAVKLSAGVALPQTGPTGTLMSFSVDYRFTQSGPDPAAKYVWVIERSQGVPHQGPVQLNSRGMLQAIVSGWHPEEGPFESYIAKVSDEGSLDRMSASIPLR